MQTYQTLIITWMIIGMINLIILKIIIKKYPNKMIHHADKGTLYWSTLLILWFTFAFIIIPIYLIKFLRSQTLKTLYKINKYLIEKNKRSQ